MVSNTNALSLTASKGTSFSFTIVSLMMPFISMGMTVIMIKFLQSLFFLLFINVNIPPNASRLLDNMRKSILDYFPTILRLGGNKKREETANTFRRMMTTATTTEAAKRSDEVFSQFCIPHKKLDENQQTCSVFINLGSFITQLVLLLVLKLIIYWIKRIREKSRKRR